MIGLTYDQLTEKILQSSGMTSDELKQKIDAKMDQLSGLISKEGAAHIIANELGIKLFKTEGELKLNDVALGMRTVEVTGKIVRKYEERTFESNGRTGKVASMIIGDETGILRVALWNDQADKFAHLKEGDIVRLTSAMVRNNNGRIELHLNNQSKLALNPEGVSIQAKEMPKASRKKLSELTETDKNVEVLGTIVQVYDLRFWESCAECNKRATQKDGLWYCPTHQQITPDYNYVLNTFLDDGTESLRVTFWKKQIQTLLGKEDAEVQSYRLDPSGFEPLKTELLGNIIKVVGNARRNEQMNSLEFTANLVYKNPDPNEELKSFKTNTPSAATDSVPVKEPVAQATPVQEVIDESPVIEQKPTPEKVEFETPKVEEKPIVKDTTGIDDDLVNIEDLEDLDDLDEI